MSFDTRDYARAKFNTPIAPPADMSQRLNLAPGTCVKSKGDLNTMICGIVSRNARLEANPATNECVVIGHGWLDVDAEVFVWRGTQVDFDRIWQGD